MNFYSAVIALHVCISVLLILLVLLQHGKGADAGATFGGGANSVFGAGGADNVFSKATTVLAFMFMVTAFSLAVRANTASATKSEGRLFQDAPQKVEATTSETEAAKQTSPSTTESAPAKTAPKTESAVPATEVPVTEGKVE
jgi:preprotein translocase subunit SecG